MVPALQKIKARLSQDISLRKALIQQLEKDLGTSFLSPDDELPIICDKLREILDQNPGEWNTWLYRIDVEEKRLPGLYSQPFELNEIVWLILEREMQKVLFRKQYHT